jgi:peptide/nickel transport system ATP-binding protein
MQPPVEARPQASQVVLRAQSVDKTYVSRDWMGRTQSHVALTQASLALHHGETVGIVGESGSGKSTLARCIMRLIDPGAGEIFWGEDEVARRPERSLRPLRHRVQVVFQDPNRSLNPRRTVGQSLVEGAIHFGCTPEQARARAVSWMEQVQLPASALERYPHEFSGGQRQRIALARALACEPQVLVADEAVSALDVSVQAQIVALLRDIQRQLGLGLLFITHDLRVAAQLCDRVIVMSQGKMVESGTTQSVYAAPQHPYTRHLFDSAPKGLESL